MDKNEGLPLGDIATESMLGNLEGPLYLPIEALDLDTADIPTSFREVTEYHAIAPDNRFSAVSTLPVKTSAIDREQKAYPPTKNHVLLPLGMLNSRMCGIPSFSQCEPIKL
jgi:hypothetical protein